MRHVVSESQNPIGKAASPPGDNPRGGAEFVREKTHGRGVIGEKRSTQGKYYCFVDSNQPGSPSAQFFMHTEPRQAHLPAARFVFLLFCVAR